MEIENKSTKFRWIELLIIGNFGMEIKEWILDDRWKLVDDSEKR